MTRRTCAATISCALAILSCSHRGHLTGPHVPRAELPTTTFLPGSRYSLEGLLDCVVERNGANNGHVAAGSERRERCDQIYWRTGVRSETYRVDGEVPTESYTLCVRSTLTEGGVRLHIESESRDVAVGTRASCAHGSSGMLLLEPVPSDGRAEHALLRDLRSCATQRGPTH